MFPRFTEDGLLPPGIHDFTWLEVEQRFSLGERRSKVTNDLRHWLLHMKAAGCAFVYVDGSFVTAKPDPNDFDACFDPTGIDRSKLDPVLLDRSTMATARIKQTFGGDIRLDKEWPPGSISPYMKFFQTDSRTGAQKGILRLDLTRDPL